MEEFRQHGVSGASISRISATAGVGRSVFYFHFPTKGDALREVRDMFESSYADRIAGARDLQEVLDCLVEGILEGRAAVGNPTVFGQMLALETDPSTSQSTSSTAAAALVRQFVIAAEKGELREGLDPEHAAHLCLRSLFGCLVGGTRDEVNCRRDLRAVTELFREMPKRTKRPAGDKR